MTDRILTFTILCLVLSFPLGFAATFTGEVMLNFVFLWPLFMAALWMAGGIYFWFHRERYWSTTPDISNNQGADSPLISMLIPCYNEGPNVRETVEAALKQRYTNLEVIAINDGSSDNTGDILTELAIEYPTLRVIHLAENQGKAIALRTGAAAAKSDFLVCIDGDALPEPDMAAFLVAPLIKYPRVGAVTGNPRIRTRSTLVGRIQVGEFSSIIGLIKRTQRIYGHVFTVSGVITAFRRTALEEVGYWSPEMITEDIDISWKLQLQHWSIFFEPRAICWILMPETIKGLWKQRLRWAQGGAEVFVKNMKNIWSFEHKRMWVLLGEFMLSTLWAFSYAMSVLLFIVGLFVTLPINLHVETLFPPHFTGITLAVVCLLQFLVSIIIEHRYENKIFQSLFWVVWFPVVYWMLSLFTTLVAFPKVMLKKQQRRARWSHSDRGIERTTK